MTLCGSASVSGGETGSITVNANGTQGEITLGGLAAKTVTVNAAGALGDVTIGTINVNSGFGGITAETVTFTGSELKANEVYVTASKEATLTGGIDDDTFMLVANNGKDTTSKFTITGGLGDDQFLIDYNQTLKGKAIATITDFGNGADTTNIDAGSLGVFKDDNVEGGLTAAQKALGVLQEAGFAPLTADKEDISFLDLKGDTHDSSVFTYGGNTYAVVGDWDTNSALTNDTHDENFDNGEILIVLTGVQDAAAINTALNIGAA